MELFSLLIRTVIIYFVVFLIMRLMGKREIGKMSVFDLIISFMIAESAVIVIEDTERAIWDGVVPMLGLMVIQVSIAFVSMHSRKLRLLFDGRPSIIIANGKLDRETMRKQRYNLDDLMQQLRENQIVSVHEVEFAILETSGKLSVIKKESAKSEENAHVTDSPAQPWLEEPKQPDMTELQQRSPVGTNLELPAGIRFETLPIPIIMEGKVMEDGLSKIGKNRFWLKKELGQKGVSNTKDVFFCSIDHKGRLFVDIERKPAH
ncbi:DUF421 domain-containing protein [Paenibacillus beijingensis]|uniref:Membrane protein n=1 Tax=Paenibacillus beijingensis TaxID=1126833 RepID=A0A0D5NM68_9BACL|nr:DUF421 domain-containing protein [Paenibacillus beijingensis]AJY76092.1 membrane protein [Paenibacillus beijingensis]